MSSIIAILKREPAIVRGAITALAIALVHVLVVFGISLPADVDATVTGTIDAIFTILGLVWIRSGVSPATDAVPATDSVVDPH